MTYDLRPMTTPAFKAVRKLFFLYERPAGRLARLETANHD